MEVFQFWFPATTCARPRIMGLIRATVGTSLTMALASSRVRVVVLPAPPRAVPGPRPKLPAET
jgi:hypothetical protein